MNAQTIRIGLGISLCSLSGLSVPGQTCTDTQNTSIPPGVLSFPVEFVDKFNKIFIVVLEIFIPPLQIDKGWI